MLLKILFYLFIITGTINLIHFALYLVGANFYDVKALRRNHEHRTSRKRRARNPLVSVLIPAYNEALVVERCLDSIRRSSYKKVEVIVNNDASTDETSAIVRNYQRRYPKFNLRLVNRRHNAGKAPGLNYVAKSYARGDLVMMLDADSILHGEAIKNTVRHFDNKAIVGVAANVRIIEESTVLGLLQRFEHMVGYRSKKFYTVANCELIIGGVASTYRKSILKFVRYYNTETATEDIGLSMKIAATGNKEHRLIYAADVAAMTEGVNSFKGLLRQRYRWKLGNLQNLIKYKHLAFSRDAKYTKTLTWYRVPIAFLGEIMLLLEPVAMGYIVYVSLRFATLGFFISAYMAITVYILMTIWPDEHLSVVGKIKASLYAPLLYFIFYVMNLVQLISIIRCLINKDQVLHLHKGDSTWVSPVRVGKAVSFS